jgi:hypothetical protein
MGFVEIDFAVGMFAYSEIYFKLMLTTIHYDIASVL